LRKRKGKGKGKDKSLMKQIKAHDNEMIDT